MGSPILEMANRREAARDEEVSRKEKETREENEQLEMGDKIAPMVVGEISQPELEAAAKIKDYIKFEQFVGTVWNERLESVAFIAVRKFCYPKSKQGSVTPGGMRINNGATLERISSRVLQTFLRFRDKMHGPHLFARTPKKNRPSKPEQPQPALNL